MNKFLTLYFLILFGISNAFSQGVEFKKMKWADALSTAEKENKLIFLDAYTTWCVPCKMMEKDVFPNESIGSFYNSHFLCVKMDMEQGEGLAVARMFNIHAFPTFVFIDGKGNALHIEAGGKTIEQTLAMANLALNPSERLAAKDKHFNEGGSGDVEFLKIYTEQRFLLQNNSHLAATDAYLALQNDLSTADNMNFIMKYVQNPGAKAFTYLLDNKAKFIKSFGKQKVDSKIEGCVYNELYEGKSRTGIEAMQNVLKRQYGEQADFYLARYKIILAKAFFDKATFVTASVDFFKQYPPDDPAEFSNIALYSTVFPPDNALLKKTLEWVDKGIKQEDNFDCRYAKARLYQHVGKKSKAKKYAKQAISFAKKNGENPEKAVKLLEVL